MAITSDQVSVGTSPTLVVAERGAGYNQIYLGNRDGAKSIYLGDENVTTATGFQLSNGVDLSNPITLPPNTVLYAVTTAGTARLDVLAIGG